MKRRIMHKKTINYKRRIMFYSIFFMLFFVSMGYAYLNTTLSINSHVVLSANHSLPVEDLLGTLILDNSCITKYEGQVTDRVGITETATNVYFNNCSDKRNVIFGGFCWQIIRSSQTGGIKMIYNGEAVDGKCQSSRSDHKGVVQSGYSNQTINSSYLYGSSFTYDTTNNTFTLTGTSTAMWSDSTYQNLLGKFTCKTLSDTCTTMYQINSYASNTNAYLSYYNVANTNYAQIGTSAVNANYSSPAMVGYMFNKVYNYTGSSAPASGALMGNDVSYANGIYTLLPASGESVLGTIKDDTHHYTCNSSSSTCNKVRYYYFDNYYIELDGVANIETAVNDMLYANDVNMYNSSIKGIIDNWYAQNLSINTSLLEDTVYCNSRSMINQTTNGWNKNGSISTYMFFKNYSGSTTDLTCTNETDQFAVSNNYAKLTYPVGLLQNEEITNINDQTLIASNANWWSYSPAYYSSDGGFIRIVDSGGNSYGSGVYFPQGIRPVVTLSQTATISSGSGTEIDPWIVDIPNYENTIGTYSRVLSNTYLSDTYRNKIKTITLNNSINIPNDAVISWDISVNQDNSVKAYLKTNSIDNTMYDLYIEGDGVLYSNPDSSKLFYNMSNLESINNLTILNTSKTTNMKSMFAFSSKLTTIDLSNFDTSKVTDMGLMFAGYISDSAQVDMSLTNIVGLNDLDVSHVTNMYGLFLNLNKITSIDISNWQTPSVTNMGSMFNNSNSLNSLLTTITFGSGFDTSNVTSMSFMFADNPNLVNLNVSNFNTSNVETMWAMFVNSTSMTSLNLSNWNTSKVTNMADMFNGNDNMSSNITTITFGPNFDTSNVTDMRYMFADNPKLANLDVSNFNTTNVTNMGSMFARDKSLTYLDLRNWNTSKVTNISRMFSGYFDETIAYDMALATIDGIENINTSLVTDMQALFMNCGEITSINLSNWNTSNVTKMRNMFNNVNSGAKLSSITFGSNFDTSNVTDMFRMFANNSALTSLDVSMFNTANVTNMGGMFDGVTGLNSLNLSNFNTANVISMHGMFKNCSNLINLNIGNFTFNSVQNFELFANGMPSKAAGAQIRVKDNLAKSWILNLTNSDRPSDWDTTNIIIN